MPYRSDHFTGPFTLASATLGNAGMDTTALGCTGMKLTYHSMEADTLTWTQRGGIALAEGEVVWLMNAAGRLIFWGLVVQPRSRWINGVTVYNYTVQGPWFYLEQMRISGAYESTAGTVEAPFYQAPMQAAGTTIRALIDQARLRDVPILKGRIGDGALAGILPTLPAITFDDRPIAKAIVDVMSAIPDATTAIQYYNERETKLDVLRRGRDPNRIVTLQIGLESHGVQAADLRARDDFRATEVTVQAYYVNGDGSIGISKQVASTGETVSGPDWRKQYIAMTGPGQEAWREPKVDKVTITYVGAPGGTATQIRELFYKADKAMADQLQDMGSMYWVVMSTSKTFYLSTGNGYTSTTLPTRSTIELMDTKGNTITGTMKDTALIMDSLPDWWDELEIPTQKVRMGKRFGADSDTATIQAKLQSLSMWQTNTGTAYIYYARDSVIEFYAVNAADALAAGVDLSTYPVTIVRPRDAESLKVPASLAQDLLDAQNWTPYDGTVTLNPGAEVIPKVGDDLNLRGGDERWRTMMIPTQSVERDLDTGETTLSYGAPARISPSSLQDRFRRSVQDGTLMKLT